MFNNREIIRLVILGLILVAGIVSVGTLVFSKGQVATVLGAEKDNFLTVAFLDVGQGDAIYIETFDGVQLLMDGGVDTTVLRTLPKEMPLLDKSIDVVVATHPDKDHIGGLIDILKRYRVEAILSTENISETTAARAFAERVEMEGANIYQARAGQEYLLGASTTLFIFSPASNPENWESNTASIVAQLRYGEIEFMLTGDAPLAIEEYLVKTYGNYLESEVLKLGHHGSRTSTSEVFLDTVLPTYAIVLAGEDNTYGHPHSEVVEALKDRNIEILETAVEGTIVFQSDGDKVWKE